MLFVHQVDDSLQEPSPGTRVQGILETSGKSRPLNQMTIFQVLRQMSATASILRFMRNNGRGEECMSSSGQSHVGARPCQ